jgi:hypothetical protein
LVDYDSRYFNLSQTSPGSDLPDIVAIQPRSDVLTSNVPTKSSKLPTGAYAGISVGTGILTIVVGLLLLSRMKTWWPFKRADSRDSSEPYYGKAELHDHAVVRVEAMEMERAELETKEPRHEVASSDNQLQEVTCLNELHELDATARIYCNRVET